MAEGTNVIDTLIDVDDDVIFSQVSMITGDDMGNIYYTTDDKSQVVKMNISSKNTSVLYTEGGGLDLFSCVYYNDSVYFTTRNELSYNFV